MTAQVSKLLVLATISVSLLLFLSARRALLADVPALVTLSVTPLRWLFDVYGSRSLHDTRKSLLQEDVNEFVQTYRDSINSFVQQQTMSWQNHFVGLEKDERSEEELEEARTTLSRNPPVHFRDIRRTVKIQSRDNGKETVDTQIVWDSEEDIPLYLEDLNTKCAQDASETDTFYEECWDRLHDLITIPRCTTRLDSRYRCGGEVSKPVITGRALLQNHFQEDTLNIAIIGAGPVGLILANELSGISMAPSGKRKLRVVVFENRLHESGFKKAYSRNWISDLRMEYFKSRIDPLLERLFETVHWPGYYSLPIHATETLFLLSNRHRGIKFLYDDYRNYKDILSKTPNLVVFDATGHRMNVLNREIAGQGSASTGKPWSWFPMRAEKQHFELDQYEDLKKTDSLVHIVEQETAHGPLLFPVSKSGRPYHAHMIKINDVRMKSDRWKELDDMQEEMLSDVSRYCQSNYSPCTKDVLSDKAPLKKFSHIKKMSFDDMSSEEVGLESNESDEVRSQSDGRVDQEKVEALTEEGWNEAWDDEESNEEEWNEGDEQEEWDEDWGENDGDEEWSKYRDEKDIDESNRYEWDEEWTDEDVESDSSETNQEDSEDGGESEKRKSCFEWCGRLFVYDAPNLFREDISEKMGEEAPENLGQTLVLSSITGEQADALWYLLGGNAPNGAPERLLRNLPLSRMASLGVFHPNNFERVLAFFAKADFWGSADVNLFQYRPYMYKVPLVSGGLFGEGNIPLVRIGDSLSSGDPNTATGLGFHIQVIQDLVDRLSEYVVPTLNSR